MPLRVEHHVYGGGGVQVALPRVFPIGPLEVVVEQHRQVGDPALAVAHVGAHGARVDGVCGLEAGLALSSQVVPPASDGSLGSRLPVGRRVVVFEPEL